MGPCAPWLLSTARSAARPGAWHAVPALATHTVRGMHDVHGGAIWRRQGAPRGAQVSLAAHAALGEGKQALETECAVQWTLNTM